MAFISPILATAATPGLMPLGVLTVRLDPRGSFSGLFKASQLGLTGETYAFDQPGRMISKSRFLEQLKTNNSALAHVVSSIFTVNLHD